MLHIRTFGGLWLERDGRRIDGNSPRRSALLATLAAAGDRGVSRDRLLLLLWPDATEERARHNLSQTVYSINRQFTDEIIGTTGSDLRLIGPVSSDVGQFLAAYAAGDAASMAEHYQGPFLDGFILSDAAEFEEWSSGERRRLDLLAREAFERLAAAEPTGPRAIGLWRRLAAIDPLATRYAVALARAVAQAGDPGAAIKLLRTHQQYLRSETGVATPEEVTRLLAELTATPIPSPPAPSTSPPVGVPPATTPSSTPSSIVPEPPPAEAVASTTPSTASPAPRSRLPWLRPAAMAIIALAAVGAAMVLTKDRVAKPLTGGAMVVLADVDNLTDDPGLGPAISVAASVGLQQSGTFSVYPRSRLRESLRRLGRPATDTVLTEGLAREIALREAGRAIVAISIARLGDGFLIAGRILEPSTGQPLAARRESVANTADLLDGLDRLVGWVREQLGDDAGRDAPRLPLVTTPSLPALVALAEADRALERGDYQRVRPAIERALATDTGFAAARVLLGEFLLARNQVPEGLRWLREAEARSDRLTEAEQLVVASALASAEGRTADAITAAGALATRFPSTNGWFRYGEALRAIDRSHEALEAYSKAIALDSNFASAHHSIALVLHRTGDTRGALDAFQRVWRADSSLLLRDYFNMQWGSTYVTIGAMAEAESVFRKMLSRDSANQARGHRSLGYLAMYQGRFRGAVEHLEAAVGLNNPRGLSAYRDLLLLADAELSRGRQAQANRALDRAMTIFRGSDLQAGFLTLGGHQLIRADRLREARLVLDSLAARAALRPRFVQDQEALAVLRADLALALGRPAEAAAAIGARPLEDFWALGMSIRAEALAGTGQLDSALVLARAVVDTIRFGVEGQLEAFRTFGRLARIAEGAGDSATARAAYSSLLARWKDGDPDLPLILEARRELLRLQPGANR
jgi:DNA-binding SARP family transcriptional activator/tetratricopeptide (TPR) repeat protein